MYNNIQRAYEGQRKIFVLDEDGNTGFNNSDKDNSKSQGRANVYNNLYSRYDADEGIADMNKRNYGNGTKPFRKRNTNSNRKITKDDSPLPKSYSELTSSFFKKSSVYALSQIGNSNTTRRKVFWAFILIGGIIGCCSQVYRYLSAYYEYPVVINIDSVNWFNQKFPGVTICNLNAVRSKNLGCVIWKIKHNNCFGPYYAGPNDLKTAVTWNSPYCFEENGTTLSDEFVERIQFISLYYSLDDSSRFHYGHQIADFIQSCSFNGEECSHTDFTLHPDGMYGNCFTFNKANATKEPLRTSFVGPNSGLTLELDVQSPEYTWLSKSVGARVVIHDPYQEPTPQDQGINVSPGFETVLGLSLEAMKRLPYPYKDHCKKYEKGDSKRNCDTICNKKKVSKHCSCSAPFGALYAERYCNFANLSELCCVYQGQKEEDLEVKYNITCDCPLECESVSYELKISSGVWPARSENLGEEYKNANLEELRETKLKLKVYYDTLEQLTYEQKPMFEDSEVLSQVGGQMGLWLGLSLAAMFECLENIVLLWHYRKKKAEEERNQH
ncbi:FMRFamide-activated amiloride-sensitive sodium channel-like [Argiope bruennichi]|uniref:FMRFamide-activated amiloride-sensitive sodium like protein n=1 Tax=Argiope bruennichi TaxID=94029 RepID=A0A8T0FSD7_ARGBR|nr:FMRFamide-activated amiloride-sensitive sodium channel-like [Argiope bruennichi]KAF8793542.1 FMRFamide-activated amiloride-sensitive sodium like protein [Argiope bruennichi]